MYVLPLELAHPEKIRGKHPKPATIYIYTYIYIYIYIHTFPYRRDIFLHPSLPTPFLSYSKGRNEGEFRFPREAIKWHFPVANINLFAVDRANIRSVGPGGRQWKERICGLRPWEYYGFKVSRESLRVGVTRDISGVIFPYSDIE